MTRLFLCALLVSCASLTPDELAVTPTYGWTDYPRQTSQWDSKGYGIGLGMTWHLGSQRRAREATIAVNEKMDRLIQEVRFSSEPKGSSPVSVNVTPSEAKPPTEEQEFNLLWAKIGGGLAAVAGLLEWIRRSRKKSPAKSKGSS